MKEPHHLATRLNAVVEDDIILEVPTGTLLASTDHRSFSTYWYLTGHRSFSAYWHLTGQYRPP